ncbi:histidine phosphatase superfamily [Flagelloscypha sp. PMI_526]|nr:histidine phosphatase superfamily [Flagelloscypha sp. PMI_526]
MSTHVCSLPTPRSTCMSSPLPTKSKAKSVDAPHEVTYTSPSWRISLVVTCMLAYVTYNVFFVSRPLEQYPFHHKTWAQYTPYHPVEGYPAPPPNCAIDQIQRHGARYPTLGASARIVVALNHILSATTYNTNELQFLRNYTYSLGSSDLLPYGAEESRHAGEIAFERYPQLVSAENLPFVRSSSGERCVLSATNWTAGFSLASKQVYNPEVSVIISEELNDTLDDAMCPNHETAWRQTQEWTNVFAKPLADALNQAAPGATLTTADMNDFMNFEYTGSLDKYYGTGYDVGYINELLARLTQSPVRDNTQTNRTLDENPETFPLNKTIYADFSHDNLMIARTGGVWNARELVPFAGRMVTERIAPLAFCGGDRNGMCHLDKSSGGRDWEKCFS